MHFEPLEAARFAPDRPVSQMLLDSPDARLVVFGLEPGQEVPPHTSTSTVLMQALQGEGSFTVGAAEFPAAPGCLAVCRPNETHGMKAKSRMVVLAVIAPRP